VVLVVQPVAVRRHLFVGPSRITFPNTFRSYLDCISKDHSGVESVARRWIKGSLLLRLFDAAEKIAALGLVPKCIFDFRTHTKLTDLS